MNPAPWKLVVAAGVTALLIAVVFTRMGAFLVFDFLGDIGSEDVQLDFEDGPLHASVERSASGLYDLPEELEQPSGIYHDGETLYVATDQSEVFLLTPSFELRQRRALIGGPLLARHGAIKGITVTDEGLLGVGEIGAVGVWRTSDWERLPSKPVALDLEFTGIAEQDGILYATTARRVGQPAVLANLTSGAIEEIRFGPFLKAGRSTSELQLSGIAADAEQLYVVTGNFTSIIVVDPRTLSAIEVVDIDEIEASDISVHEGRAFVTVDHKLVDERPALYAYDLDR